MHYNPFRQTCLLEIQINKLNMLSTIFHVKIAWNILFRNIDLIMRVRDKSRIKKTTFVTPSRKIQTPIDPEVPILFVASGCSLFVHNASCCSAVWPSLPYQLSIFPLLPPGLLAWRPSTTSIRRHSTTSTAHSVATPCLLADPPQLTRPSSLLSLFVPTQAHARIKSSQLLALITYGALYRVCSSVNYYVIFILFGLVNL